MDLHAAKEQFGLNYVIFRPFNVYGERQFLGDPYRNVIGIFMNRIMQDKDLPIYGDGEQKRAFTYVKDISPCIVNGVLNHANHNQIFNLGAAKVYTLNELSQTVLEVMNSKNKRTYLPPRKEVKYAFSMTEKAEKMLGYIDKTTLSEGLCIMAEWAKKRGPMTPIIWEGYELVNGLPSFWENLSKEYPYASKRIKLE